MFVAKAPSIDELLGKLGPEAAMAAIDVFGHDSAPDRYLHWDKLRHLDPPEGLSSEQWWLRLKFARKGDLRPLPLTDPDGEPFAYGLLDSMLRSLHRIDQRCSGEVAMDEVVTSERRAGRRFVVNSLMEEAIRSSQLEGATTSRVEAKELLRSGREPKDRSERMIANNYRALQFMRDEMGETLSPESVLELHRIVTEGTLDDPSAAGRLQQLCDFANEDDEAEPFVHPVVRAILLHFWLAYEQSIEDLHHYLERKIAEVKDVEQLLQADGDLNGRQLALLIDAIRHPDSSYSFDSHAASHRVTHETARSDLRPLADRGLLVRRGKGRKHIFEPVPDLPDRLKESGA